MDHQLQMARCEGGFLIRIVGGATMRESMTFKDVIAKCLDAEGHCVVIDLEPCNYLDSTFLGCLVQLHQKFNKPSKRFVFHAPHERRSKLFSRSSFDRLLHFGDAMPAPVGKFVDVELQDLDQCELGEHILNCHQRLVDLGGETAEVYGPIVERLKNELGNSKDS